MSCFSVVFRPRRRQTDKQADLQTDGMRGVSGSWQLIAAAATAGAAGGGGDTWCIEVLSRRRHLDATLMPRVDIWHYAP